MTAPATATRAVHPEASRTVPRRRRPPVHIVPEPSWTALGQYLASR